MEYSSNDSSDKDRKMMNKFESLEEEDDSDEKKDKKKSKRPFFEIQKDDEKPEKRGSIFDDLKHDTKEKDELDEEELTDDEVQLVAEQYIDERGEEINRELESAEPESPEEAAFLANEALLETIDEKIQQGKPIDEAMLDEAFVETTQELGIPNKEGLLDVEASDTLTESSDEEEPERPTTYSSTTSTPPPPSPPFSPAGSPPAGGGTGINTLSPTPNTPPKSPDVIPVVPHTRAGDLLVGGIIGYMIGRRGGRIRTEAKLLPVQEALEREVKDLHKKIAFREEKIRKLALEKSTISPVIIREKLSARKSEQVKLKLEKTEDSPIEHIETIKDRKLHRAQAERLVRMVLPKAEILPTPNVPKKVESMSSTELLQIAQGMEVDGVSVRSMYESGRIDEISLKRAVSEFLEGHDYERLITEKIRHEQSPEIMREDVKSSAQVSQAGGGSSNLMDNKPSEFISPRDLPAVSLPKPNFNYPTPAKEKSKKPLTKIGVIVAIILALGFAWLLLNH